MEKGPIALKIVKSKQNTNKFKQQTTSSELIIRMKIFIKHNATHCGKSSTKQLPGFQNFKNCKNALKVQKLIIFCEFFFTL